MKIALDVSQIVYEGTGVANYTKELTSSLIKNFPQEEYVFYAGALKKLSTINHYRKSSPWKKAKWNIAPLPPKLASLLFNKLDYSIDNLISDFDVLHTSDWTEPRSKKPTVTTVHDLVFRRYPDTVNELIKETQQLRLSRIKDQSCHIIVDSQNTKKDLIDLYKIDESRISTVYLAPSEIFTPLKKDQIKKTLTNLNLNSEYILFVGTQEPRKNLQKSIESFRSFKEKYKTDHKFVVVGNTGWGEKANINQKDIINLGRVDEELLPALYSGCDAFLFPSLYEGFGLPVLEAMACGAPVITSDNSSLSEISGDAAILIDPHETYEIRDALKKAITRKSSLESASLKQASKFSWDKTAEKTYSIYKNVVEANQ